MGGGWWVDGGRWFRRVNVEEVVGVVRASAQSVAFPCSSLLLTQRVKAERTWSKRNQAPSTSSSSAEFIAFSASFPALFSSCGFSHRGRCSSRIRSSPSASHSSPEDRTRNAQSHPANNPGSIHPAGGACSLSLSQPSSLQAQPQHSRVPTPPRPHNMPCTTNTNHSTSMAVTTSS